MSRLSRCAICAIVAMLAIGTASLAQPKPSQSSRPAKPGEPSSKPVQEYPDINGYWKESKGVIVHIIQKGTKWTAECAYVHPDAGEVRWKMDGTITLGGKIRGKLWHTKAPKDWLKYQTREGQLAKDGKAIVGAWKEHKGEFTWVRQKDKAAIAERAKALAGIVDVINPLLEKPRSLEGLHGRLDNRDGNAAKRLGFIARPLEIGSAGLTESILVINVIDKSNMLARIRFPELQYPEYPAGFVPTRRMQMSNRATKSWASGDQYVHIRGVNTTGLIDGRVIWLTIPLKVVGTIHDGASTIYSMAPNPKKRPQNTNQK